MASQRKKWRTSGEQVASKWKKWRTSGEQVENKWNRQMVDRFRKFLVEFSSTGFGNFPHGIFYVTGPVKSVREISREMLA